VADATNQDKPLMSTTSGGNAQTMGATDVCFDPSMTTTAPFPNTAPNNAASTHSSTKTQLESGPVIRQGDKVGPPSDPAHPNTGGGANAAGNPYRQPAEGQKGSPNVRVEGTPPNRITDPTTNNNANTNGQFKQGGSPAETPPAAPTPKEACHITEVFIECRHGRKNGPDKILEILGCGDQDTGPAGAAADKTKGLITWGQSKMATEKVAPATTLEDLVKLAANRIDARTKGNPTCEPKTHTNWVLEKTALRVGGKKAQITGDKIVMGGDWLDYGADVQGQASVTRKDGPDRQTLKKGFLDEMLAKKNAERAANGKKPVGLKKLGNSYRTDANKRADAAIADEKFDKRNAGNINKGAMVLSKAVEFGTFLEIVFARKLAPTIAVKAEACSGAQDYKVRLFPPIKAEASITGSSPAIKAVKATTAVLEKMMKVFKKLASMAGLSVDAGVHVCEGGGIMFEAKWAEMTEDVPDLNLFKHMCDLGCEVNFGFEKFIGIWFNVGVPIAAFANVFFPGAGTTLASALNWLGVEATIGVDVEFALSPLFKIGKDPGKKVDWDIDLDLIFKVFFNVKIKWGKSVEVAGGVLLSGDPAIDKLEPAWPLPQIGVVFKDGEIKIGFQGYVKVDILWWSVNESIQFYPEACQVRYQQFTVKPFAWMSSST